MKTEIMQKIIDKQGEIDNVRVNQLLNLNEQLSPNNFTLPIYQLEMKYNSLCSKITLLRSELASLKSQLAEAGEEDVYTKSLRLLTEFMDKTPSEEKTELKICINCKYREAVYSDIMCDNCYYHRHWQPR